jgi:hypothetical protein
MFQGIVVEQCSYQSVGEIEQIRRRICPCDVLDRSATKQVDLQLQSQMRASLCGFLNAIKTELSSTRTRETLQILLATVCSLVMDGVDQRNIEAKQLAVQNGAISLIITILSQSIDGSQVFGGSEMDIDESCCWLISWLTRWSSDTGVDARAELAVDLGIVPRLIAIVGKWEISKRDAGAAAYALANLWFSSESARVGASLPESRTLKLFADALCSGNQSLSSNISSGLGNLWISRGAFQTRHREVLETNLIFQLHALAVEAAVRGDVQMQQRCVMSLSYLTQSPCCHPELIKVGVGVLFLAVLEESGDDAKTFLLERCTIGVCFLFGSEERSSAFGMGAVGRSQAVPLIVSRLKSAMLGDEAFSSTTELVFALHILSINDLLKPIISSYPGVLSLLTDLISAPTSASASLAEAVAMARQHALNCVSQLCFDPSSRILICTAEPLIAALTTVAESPQTALSLSVPTAQCALHALGRSKTPHPSHSLPPPSSQSIIKATSPRPILADPPAAIATKPLIFISYSWAYQPAVLSLKARLAAPPYNMDVWIDTEQVCVDCVRTL